MSNTVSLLSNAPLWKKIFIVLAFLLLVLMPLVSNHYGQNGDENVEIIYGQDLFNYYANGDKQALHYDPATHPFGNNIEGMHYYGGMFDLVTEAIHRAVPSWHIVAVRHFVSALLGALLMIFTGLLTVRLTRKNWMLGTVALLCIALSPRIFGESMSNGKDIPFATGMVMGMYFLVALLQKLRTTSALWKDTIGLALSWALVFGVRSAGGLLFVAYIGLFTLLYFILHKEERTVWKDAATRKKLLVRLGIAFVAGYIIGLLFWPYALQSPIANVFAALEAMTNRQVNIRVLFDGAYYYSTAMPWYYELKWIFITNPIIVLAGAVGCVLLFSWVSKQYGWFAWSLVVFGAFFPLFYIVYKNSTVYDTWRHVFFVYPFWVIMAILTVGTIIERLPSKWKWMPLAIVLLGLLPTLFWTIRTHPNQYVYFNALTGGLKGAYGKYDIDYYHNVGRQLAAWVKDNASKKSDGSKTRVLSNMDGMEYYFKNDTSWIHTQYGRYYERAQNDWDYYITFSRFVSPWQLENNKWPPPGVVYSVVIDDVPIGVVLQRKSNASMLAHKAMEQKDFLKAASLYAEYIKTDAGDEMVWMNYAIALASTGRIAEAIDAAKMATSLDQDKPDFYQLLGQLYQAKGDNGAAQDAFNMAQSIAAKQQENLPTAP